MGTQEEVHSALLGGWPAPCVLTVNVLLFIVKALQVPGNMAVFS